MSLIDNAKKYSFIIGITGMILLAVGTFLEGSSLPQKLLFIVGAPVLGFSAYLNKQKMFITLEAVATIGTILAFSDISNILTYAIMIGSGIVGILYLIKTNYSKEDAWWPIGGLGLMLIALGFATSAITYPIFFGFFLGFGGILVAIYSAIGFFILKTRISVIWLILNIIFSINPLIVFFTHVL